MVGRLVLVSSKALTFKEICILPTGIYIGFIHLILTTNTDYFPKQCNGMQWKQCVLWEV